MKDRGEGHSPTIYDLFPVAENLLAKVFMGSASEDSKSGNYISSVSPIEKELLTQPALFPNDPKNFPFYEKGILVACDLLNQQAETRGGVRPVIEQESIDFWKRKYIDREEISVAVDDLSPEEYDTLLAISYEEEDEKSEELRGIFKGGLGKYVVERDLEDRSSKITGYEKILPYLDFYYPLNLAGDYLEASLVFRQGFITALEIFQNFQQGQEFEVRFADQN